MDLRSYTDQYIAAFREDARLLGLEDAEENPRATDEANIAAMGELVAALDRNGHTYRSDGSVYFKISTLPDYGKLAHLDHEGMKPGARVDSDNYAKDDARDFVLWKATKPGEPVWDVVDPPGRPGWHLECSAMAMRILGESPIDIHTGGIDLIFPHHENEIAQSEGATGTQFSRFWMHVEYLIVDEQKMSKSLGNTYTIPDVVAKGFRPSAVRYLLLSAHYRKQLNFTWASLTSAEESLRRITDCLVRAENLKADGSHPAIVERVEAAMSEFSEAMRDGPQHGRGARGHLRAGEGAQLGDRRARDRPRRSAGGSRGLRPVRSRARHPLAPAGGRRAAAGTGRRDPAVHRRPARRPSSSGFCRGGPDSR